MSNFNFGIVWNFLLNLSQGFSASNPQVFCVPTRGKKTFSQSFRGKCLESERTEREPRGRMGRQGIWTGRVVASCTSAA